jgi:hypothetical protein
MTHVPISPTNEIVKKSSTPLPVNPRLLFFLFPLISESDLIAFACPLLLIILENFYNIFSSLIDGLLSFDISKLFSVAFGIITFYYIIWRLIVNAFSSKPMDTDEKRIFSNIYYVILTVLTVASLMKRMYVPLASWMDYFEITSLIYVLIRCLAVNAVIEKLAKKHMQFIYSQRITNIQITKMELIAAVITSFFIYLYMRITKHDGIWLKCQKMGLNYLL